jgi:hypothetical protein
MSRNRAALSTLLGGITLSGALALNATAQVPIRAGPSARAKPVPCWQVAGISQSAMQERRTVARQAHQEAEAVCANSSLSIQQKREQIKQIRERERQQIDVIIAPAQREAMRSCQQSRGAGHAGGRHLGGGVGPCGEMSVGHDPHPMHEQEEVDLPPNDTSKPNRIGK